MADLDKPSGGTAVADVEDQPELKRVMGPKLLLLFIIGDILGTGIYAVTGTVAQQVGGVVWLPFLLSFVVATITAFSYLELVTKYPQAAGAALYAHKAFGVHFVTFLIAFAVTCSGITSASTAASPSGFAESASITRRISAPTCRNSACPKPRVVPAGVPSRTPDVTKGFSGSFGMAFLLQVRPARSSAISARRKGMSSLASTPIAVCSTTLAPRRAAAANTGARSPAGSMVPAGART